VLTIAARNAMLAGFPGQYLSAHSAYSANGAHELDGGSPAYRRQAVAYAAPAGAVREAAERPVFDIPARATVRYIGLWDSAAGGTFLGMIANGGSEKPVALDTQANTLRCQDHGFADGDTVCLYGDSVPLGLVEGAAYPVHNRTTHTFQLKGADDKVLEFSGAIGRHCVVSAIVEEGFKTQGTLSVGAHSVRLGA
jgi:hypothetical protein